MMMAPLPIQERPRASLRGYALSLLMVAASTLAGLLIAPRWGTSPVDLIFLPAVLAAAVFAGLGPAVVAATASALAFNYFFTEPYHTFRILSAADLVTVLVLFAVALVTSQLAASIREQARIAESHAQRNATIAGFARMLLSCSSEMEIANAAVKQLARLFDCNAVFLTGQGTPRVLSAEPPAIQLAPSDLAAAAVVLATGEPTGRGLSRVSTVEWQVHPVRSERAVLAAVALARDDGQPPVAQEQLSLVRGLFDQVALALERARLESEARDFATLRERDRLRSTLLSTIGQDIKPRLAAIADAAAKLQRGGTADRELVSDISAEAGKLDRYVDNLVELGPESNEKPVDIGGVRIDLFNRHVTRDGETVHLTPKEYAVLAELAKYPGRVLTHAHLLRTAWGPAQEKQTEYLRVAVRALRQKLERDARHPQIIVNEPAVGYRLAAPPVLDLAM